MSRYHQLYDSTGASKFTTLATSGTSARTQVNSRRITVIGNGTAHFIAFGTSTVVATTSSCVVPAGAVLDFHFTSGEYVAALAASGTGYITIIDSD